MLKMTMAWLWGCSRHECYLLDLPRHIEDRRRGVALLAILAVSAEMHMIFADVVLTGGGELVISLALVERSSGRAATVSLMNAGCHVKLSFHYAERLAQNINGSHQKLPGFMVLKWDDKNT